MVKGTAPPSPPPSAQSPPSPPPSSRPPAASATAVPASAVPCRYLRRLNISCSPSSGVSVLVRSVMGQGLIGGDSRSAVRLACGVRRGFFCCCPLGLAGVVLLREEDPRCVAQVGDRAAHKGALPQFRETDRDRRRAPGQHALGERRAGWRAEVGGVPREHDAAG